MNVAIITGSGGLIGSEAVYFLQDKMDLIAGIDNDLRSYFFGESASTMWNSERLIKVVSNYEHHNTDIRQYSEIEKIYKKFNSDIKLIIHTAAQPSHDWAAKEPITDFTVNALGTMNMLELARNHCPDAVFIFTSTNKVYGDRPNFLPLEEQTTRWEIQKDHPYFANGIDENLSIDNSIHSIFGASKISADVMTQEYGKYFGMKTGVFRGGCLTGPNHSGAQLHGFLSYLLKCALTKTPYTIYGYKGKQVRDNIHSKDLINMFWQFYQNPKKGEVYNAGGGRHSNCSMMEAIDLCNKITGNKIKYELSEINRIGDHVWYISDLSKFKSHYPAWNWEYNLERILEEMYEFMHLKY